MFLSDDNLVLHISININNFLQPICIGFHCVKRVDLPCSFRILSVILGNSNSHDYQVNIKLNAQYQILLPMDSIVLLSQRDIETTGKLMTVEDKPFLLSICQNYTQFIPRNHHYILDFYDNSIQKPPFQESSFFTISFMLKDPRVTWEKYFVINDIIRFQSKMTLHLV